MYLFKCIIEFAHMQRGKDFSNPGLSGKPQAEPKSAVSHNPAEKLPLSENNWILFNEIKLMKQNKFNDLYPYQSQANKQEQIQAKDSVLEHLKLSFYNSLYKRSRRILNCVNQIYGSCCLCLRDEIEREKIFLQEHCPNKGVAGGGG